MNIQLAFLLLLVVAAADANQMIEPAVPKKTASKHHSNTLKTDAEITSSELSANLPSKPFVTTSHTTASVISTAQQQKHRRLQIAECSITGPSGTYFDWSTTVPNTNIICKSTVQYQVKPQTKLTMVDGFIIRSGNSDRIFEIMENGILLLIRMVLDGGGFTLTGTNNGGLIYLNLGAQLLAYNSTLANAKAFKGGAIFATTGSNQQKTDTKTIVHLERTTVYKNEATTTDNNRGGGGIASNGADSLITILHSIFKENVASNGGGIQMLKGLLNLGNTTFESNTANKLGGGLHGQVANFNMQDTLTSFSGNLAQINAQSMYLQATDVTFDFCQPGYYSPLTLPTAVNYDFIGCPITCPPGTYAPLIEARTYCSLCPYGAYCPNTDQDKVNCEPGKFSEQQAKTTEIDACRICNQGQYQSESGKAYCLDCSRGQSQNTAGSNNCTLCSPGMYNQITKAKTCVECQIGTYQSKKGQTFCFGCQPGRYQNEKGDIGINYIDDNDSVATKNVGCKKCPHNKYQDDHSQTSCKNVTAGYKSETTNQVMCPIGTYGVAGTFILSSSECSAVCGQSCNSMKDASKQECKECALCHGGCVPCDQGKIAATPGLTSCATVSPDQVVLGGAVAVAVPEGSYINQDYITFNTCPAGWIGTKPPTYQCLTCDAGMTSSVGSLTCHECGKGKFNPKINASKCIDCDVDTYQDQELKASLRCQACPNGYDQPSSGQSFCQDLGYLKPHSCDDNQYLNDTATDPLHYKCVACPEGASCVGPVTNSSVRNKYGYWRCPKLFLTFEKCKRPGNCLGE